VVQLHERLAPCRERRANGPTRLHARQVLALLQLATALAVPIARNEEARFGLLGAALWTGLRWWPSLDVSPIVRLYYGIVYF